MQNNEEIFLADMNKEGDEHVSNSAILEVTAGDVIKVASIDQSYFSSFITGITGNVQSTFSGQLISMSGKCLASFT